MEVINLQRESRSKAAASTLTCRPGGHESIGVARALRPSFSTPLASKFAACLNHQRHYHQHAD